MRSVLTSLLLLTVPVSAGAWEQKGHLIINRLAIETAASRLPEFMNASREQLIYNGFEPDRWRREGQTPMTIGFAPDHFFDSERWGSIATIEPDRYSFMEKLAVRKIELARVGFLPYAIVENYGRLVNAFRFWRNAKTPADRESARANAVFYAGVMGHYVGDGSQPLHLSIHYNGWADKTPNPKNYTKDRRLHSRYEGAYVDTAIEIATVKPKVQPPQRLKDVFGEIKQYLTQGFAELEPLYELEKTGEFNPEQPRPKGTDFIATEIARAATMLGNFWYTAWLESGEPLPAPRAGVRGPDSPETGGVPFALFLVNGTAVDP
ncbi:MAG: hypothetical protein DMG12_15770 [Acidobacteria bacterium]|nr:MAG: hypothetical protein DMG12_15770 [Acidobacteriota bacterium]